MNGHDWVTTTADRLLATLLAGAVVTADTGPVEHPLGHDRHTVDRTLLLDRVPGPPWTLVDAALDHLDTALPAGEAGQRELVHVERVRDGTVVGLTVGVGPRTTGRAVLALSSAPVGATEVLDVPP